MKYMGGQPVLTDGPFIEAKETIGGFCVVEVPDLDAAVAIAKLLRELGRPVEARQADARALELTRNPTERALLQERLTSGM
jgi:hypothetical protein